MIEISAKYDLDSNNDFRPKNIPTNETDKACTKCNSRMHTDIWKKNKSDVGQERSTCTKCGHTEVK